MFSLTKTFIRRYLPKRLVSALVAVKIQALRVGVVLSSFFIRRYVSNNTKIKVCFFIIHRSVWKLHNLYKLLEQDSRFEPIVVICPYTLGTRETQLEEFDAALKFFKAIGYNVVSSKDGEKWIDIRKKINPDIIFFTNPHNITLPAYLWKSFRDKYTCYVPYHHQVDAGQWSSQWNSPFHLSMWKLFYISKYHKELAGRKMLNFGNNVNIVGYPGTEQLYLDVQDPDSNDPWKNKDNRKRIIWAPHHTIVNDTVLGMSEFLHVAELMIDLSKRFSDQVVFAFKPHPVLKSKLYSLHEWGVERTDSYFSFWDESENTQLEEGEYISLFKHSDAMIHDSGSFLAEYLYLNKPVFYFVNDTTPIRFNEFGHRCLESCVTGTFADVEQFIINVIENKDELSSLRDNFIKDELINVVDGSFPSMRIFNILVNHFFSEKHVY